MDDWIWSVSLEWILMKVSGRRCESLELNAEDRERIEDFKRELLLNTKYTKVTYIHQHRKLCQFHSCECQQFYRLADVGRSVCQTFDISNIYHQECAIHGHRIGWNILFGVNWYWIFNCACSVHWIFNNTYNLTLWRLTLNNSKIFLN